MLYVVIVGVVIVEDKRTIFPRRDGIIDSLILNTGYLAFTLQQSIITKTYGMH